MSQKTKSNELTSRNTSSKSRTEGSVIFPEVTQLRSASVVTLASHIYYPGKSEMLAESERFLSAMKPAGDSAATINKSDASEADLPNIDYDTVQGRVFLQRKGLNNISV